MENTLSTQDVIATLNQDMAKANAELKVHPSDKFNRVVLGLIQQEIEKAKPAANKWKYLCPGVHEYTYTNQFPLVIYNELSEDFIVQLETASIYLSKNPGMDTAKIRIVFHF